MVKGRYEIRHIEEDIYKLSGIFFDCYFLPGDSRIFHVEDNRKELTDFLIKRMIEATGGPGVGYIEVDSELKKKLKIKEKDIPECVTIDWCLYKNIENEGISLSFSEATNLGFPRQIGVRRTKVITNCE